ncbi:MAG: dihydrodipicolinate synthase family protein [Anaerolineales bacterium]
MTTETSLTLAGIHPPIPTPFKADGDLDFDHLASNLEHWNGWPLAGYVVGGSNGEFVYQTAAERVAVVREARMQVPADRLLIAGSGMQSTRATVDLTARMAEAGADAALVVTPSYYQAKITGELLEHHYRQVAEASPIPVILYSVPANTGVDLPAESVALLAQRPNIIGIKDSGGSLEKIEQMVRETPEDFQVLAGSGGYLLPALELGAVGAVAALACIAGDRLAEVASRFQRGDMEGAKTLQQGLLEVNRAVTAQFGVAGLKAALDMLGLYGGPVRSPLLGLTDQARKKLRVSLERAGLL